MAGKAKRKTAKKRNTTRKRSVSYKKKSSSNRLGRDIALFISILLLAGVGGFAYYHYKNKSHSGVATKQIRKNTPRTTRKKSTKTDPIEEKISKKREAAMRADYSEGQPLTEKSGKQHEKTAAPSKKNLPKLVLIIDDVSNPKELKAIRSIPLKITPSLFPPSKYSKNTVQMAKELEHYMVHLPLQAADHSIGAMPDTLMVNDSPEQMQSRVRDIRRWFPRCVYINNHTGSLFTSNYKALYDLYGILKEKGFVFVDSRTSPKSRGKKIAEAYGDPYLYRDVFIDNIQKFGPIRKQLELAVKKARKKGYAIAIGHPHPVTLKTLGNSLDILADVDVVYMDELASRR